MRQQQPRSAWQRVALFTFAVLALYFGYQWGQRYAPSPYSALVRESPVATITALRLVDQRAQPFTAASLQGAWSLLFFAHTGQPETARSLLELSTRTLNRLADRPTLQQQVQVLMVTADPRKDTPHRLAGFMAGYPDAFLALTGETTEIDQLAVQLGITLARQGEPGQADYRVDHSTSLLLIQPDASLAGRFTGLVDAASIASDLKQIAADLEP